MESFWPWLDLPDKVMHCRKNGQLMLISTQNKCWLSMFQQIMDTFKCVYVICTVLTFLQYMSHYFNTRQEGCKPIDHCIQPFL